MKSPLADSGALAIKVPDSSQIMSETSFAPAGLLQVSTATAGLTEIPATTVEKSRAITVSARLAVCFKIPKKLSLEPTLGKSI